MRLELSEDFINKLIPKFIKIPNVSNLKVDIENGFINLRGNYMFIPFGFKLNPLKTSGSKIQFSIEGAFSGFLPKFSQKGIKLENNILEFDISEFMEEIEVKNIDIQKGKVLIEI
ncbi:MAG: hypothetical protein ABIL37_00770 [candidate division WOR-3 bacterium]